jgi:hypothetical protein
MANKYWVGPSGNLSTVGHWSNSTGAAMFTGTRPTGTNAILTITAINGGTIAFGQLLYDSGGTARGTIGTQVSGTTGGTGTYNTTSSSSALSGTLYTMAAGSASAVVPGTSDVVIFDNNSFFGTAVTATVSTTTTVGSIDASGITSGSNGITLAGTSGLTISNGASNNKAIDLPASRFTWSHSGTCTLTGTGTITTRNTTIASNMASTVAGNTITLNDIFNGTGTFTLNGGTINLGVYQWTCTIFTSTGSTATTINSSGSNAGITVTANSGTVVNVTKTTAQLTLSTTKPIFTLTASGTAAGRGLTWAGTGTTWATDTSVMPGLRITNGSDTVTVTHAASQSYYNLASFDCTGFSGTFQYTSNPANYIYVYGDFVFLTGTFNVSSRIYLSGENINNKFVANSGTFRVASATANYTQAGVINVSELTNYSNFTTGSFVLNNTGAISGYIIARGFTLVGNISFGVGSPSDTTDILNPIITSLTSITKTSSNTGFFSITGGTYNSSIPFTFNGPINTVTFRNLTINGTVTFNNAINYNISINSSTFANPLTVTTGSVEFGGIVNLPAASVFNVNATNASLGSYPRAYSTSSDTVFNNIFTVNLTTNATDSCYLDSGSTSYNILNINGPNLNLSGTGVVNFNNEGFFPWFNSVDTTQYTAGTSISGSAYIKSSLTQSPTYPAPFNVIATGDLTLNSTSIYTFETYTGINLTVNVVTQTLNAFDIFVRSGSTINLNTCVLTIGIGYLYAGSFTVQGTINSGTSTIISTDSTYGRNIVIPDNQDLYNLIVAGSVTISARRINNITNSTQLKYVAFLTNITFGTFNLNGTSGNLVTVAGSGFTQKTLTKSTPWTLGNSTNSGNNTDLTFGTSGNNNYLNISYINGVYTPVTTNSGNFFLMF